MFPPKNPHRERKRRIRGLVPIMGVLILTIFVVVSMLSGMAPAEDQLESSPNGIMRHVLAYGDAETDGSVGYSIPSMSKANLYADSNSEFAEEQPLLPMSPEAPVPSDPTALSYTGFRSEKAPDAPPQGVLEKADNKFDASNGDRCLFWEVAFDPQGRKGLWLQQLSVGDIKGKVLETQKKTSASETPVKSKYEHVALYRPPPDEPRPMSQIPREVQEWMNWRGRGMEVWDFNPTSGQWEFIGVLGKVYYGSKDPSKVHPNPEGVKGPGLPED